MRFLFILFFVFSGLAHAQVERQALTGIPLFSEPDLDKSEIKRLGEKHPSAMTPWNRGLMKQAMGDSKGASKEFELAMTSDITDDNALCLAAILLMKDKKDMDNREEYMNVLAARLVDVYTEADNKKKAKKKLSKKEDFVFVALPMIYQQVQSGVNGTQRVSDCESGNVQPDIVPLYEAEVRAGVVVSPEIRNTVGAFLEVKGEMAEAKKNYEFAASKGNIKASENLARLAERMGVKDIDVGYSAVIKAHPDVIVSRILLADSMERNGNKGSAAMAYMAGIDQAWNTVTVNGKAGKNTQFPEVTVLLLKYAQHRLLALHEEGAISVSADNYKKYFSRPPTVKTTEGK